MGKIHYIGWYIGESEFGKYTGNIPGMLKMRYVADVIIRAGLSLEVLSLASCKYFSFPKRIRQKQDFYVRYTISIGCNNGLCKRIENWLKRFWLKLYILFKVKKNDTILLYHSVGYTNYLKQIRKKHPLNVILEVEEVYGYSAIKDQDWVQDELSGILSMDKFMFVNSGIPRYLNVPRDKYVVSYGVGTIPQRTAARFDDGKIHLVYAGTIEKRKLGAFTAVETAQYLPDKYVLHILGFGEEDSIAIMQEKIRENNSKEGVCSIYYEGYKAGSDLDDFLFKCHIGISTNVMRPNFANNTFPSKVITYMCHDLTVVLGYADAFKDAPFVDGWKFYYEHTPQAIATAIKDAHLVDEGFYRPMIEKMNNDLMSFLVESSKMES